LIRLANEKPQSPCSIASSQRKVADHHRVVHPEALAQVRGDLGRDVRIRDELAERIAGAEREHR
jgi:hypothetical protein